MTAFDFVGYVASGLTTLSFLPQAIKTIKDKDTKGISLIMYSMFTFGVFLWFLYGIYKKDIPMLSGNLITFLLAVIILIMKIRYK